MDKVIVAYWSQTGNTAAMAAAIGEGITEAGSFTVCTASHRHQIIESFKCACRSERRSVQTF